LKIFYFEKSKIFQNSISKTYSKKFCIKVYKDFFYIKNLKLRKLYYITKTYYNFLSKTTFYNKIYASNNKYKKLNKKLDKKFFIFTFLFNNSLFYDISWFLNKELGNFNKIFFHKLGNIKFMKKNNKDLFFQYQNKLLINNLYINYYSIKIYHNLNFYRNNLNNISKNRLILKRKKLFPKNNKFFGNKKNKRLRSDPIFFKIYNFIYYGRTYNINFDKLYYKRYNIIYQKIMKLFYNVKYNKNYKLIYKHLYKILFYDFKYQNKYQKIYFVFNKFYNKILNKNVYKRSKNLYFYYKIFNKIINKIFYLLFILFNYRYSKKFKDISKKIFKFLKQYSKIRKNFKFYNYYKNLIFIIKSKYNYKSNYIINYLKIYKQKLNILKNKLFNKKLFNNFLFNRNSSKNRRKKSKKDKSLLVTNNYILKDKKFLSNKFIGLLAFDKKKNMNYYKLFFKHKSKYNKIYLFNLKSSFILSSYRIYNIKFFYKPILFSTKLVNKNYIKAIKRFINIYVINLSNLFFNQYYKDIKNFSKNSLIKFITIFIIKFNNNFIKNYNKNFSNKFITKFLKRFNKFFIKIFSESFTKKKSNYLYLEKYIEKTIGIFDIKFFKYVNSPKNIIPIYVYNIFIDKFNKKFIKFFKIKKILRKTLLKKIIINKKKII
jgi:hypothetical protein